MIGPDGENHVHIRLTATAALITAALLALIVIGCCGALSIIYDAGTASIPQRESEQR